MSNNTTYWHRPFIQIGKEYSNYIIEYLIVYKEIPHIPENIHQEISKHAAELEPSAHHKAEAIKEMVYDFLQGIRSQFQSIRRAGRLPQDVNQQGGIMKSY